MDKNIIIDGVNVAGCRFSELLYGAVCCNKSGLRGACNDNPECEYKQLKRLQAENEELKAGLCKQCDFQKQYFSETKKLLVENVQLKEENKKNKKWVERYKKANERLYDMQVDDFNLTKTKYKQALEEIRELNLFSLNNSREKIAKINEIVSEVLE